MAFIGFGASNPVSLASVLDTSRWRLVMYMDTPRTIARFHEAVSEPRRKKETRKMVLLVGGATCLHRIHNDLDAFASILVFDSVENLHVLKEDMPEFEIVDSVLEGGHYVSRHLNPGQVAEMVAKPGKPENLSMLQRVVNTLGKRKPSVLETTSRMPVPSEVLHSGMQVQLSEMKKRLDDQEGLEFSVVLDTYCRYLFRIIPRSKVTSLVTKKLPKELKEVWDNVLQFAKSDIGLRMAKTFEAVSASKDPRFRGSYVLAKYGISQYAGDYMYFTAVHPPSEMHEFLPELEAANTEAMENKGSFKPPSD